MPRFRLDPRDAPEEPESVASFASAPEAPAAPPVGVGAPKPRVVAPPPRTPGAKKGLTPRQRTFAIVAALVVLLGGSATIGGMYVFDVGPFAYPERYLLEKDEIPAGMFMMPIDPDLRTEIGMRENPGEISTRDLMDSFEMGGPYPEAGWAQQLGGDGPTGGDVPVVILALKFANEEDAKTAAARFRFGCAGGGLAVLRDGDVVVVVAPQDENEGRPFVNAVVSALIRKAPDLVRLC